jgi:hypothetical protein
MSWHKIVKTFGWSEHTPSKEELKNTFLVTELHYLFTEIKKKYDKTNKPNNPSDDHLYKMLFDAKPIATNFKINNGKIELMSWIDSNADLYWNKSIEKLTDCLPFYNDTRLRVIIDATIVRLMVIMFVENRCNVCNNLICKCTPQNPNYIRLELKTISYSNNHFKIISERQYEFTNKPNLNFLEPDIIHIHLVRAFIVTSSANAAFSAISANKEKNL